MVGPDPQNRGQAAIQPGRNGSGTPAPQPSPILSIDEFRWVVFLIRSARVLAFLQRFVPEKYLPPPEDRIPLALLNRLIRELKKLLPRWRWIPSARTIPRSPAKLGEEFFYAITALRTSRLDLWRAGQTDCVAVLDELYALLYAIGARARTRKSRSKAQEPEVPTA